MAGLTPLQPAALERKRRLARAALWFEQLWPAVWPALGVLGAYVCVLWLGLAMLLPAWPRLGLLVLVLLAAGLLLWWRLRRVVPPSGPAADRRLERETGLAHRPLASLGDRPALPTVEQELLWREHMRRLAAQIPRLRVGRPRPGLAARDGWALRGLVVVALAASFIVAGPDAWPRLRRGFTPALPEAAAGPSTQIQAWVTPPAYTGLPPIVLKTGMAEVRVPAGSHLIVSVTGSTTAPELAVGDAAEPFRALDAASFQAERDLGSTGTERISIRRRGGTLAAWSLALIADQPPVPAFVEPPGPNLAGGRRTLQSRFAWQAGDDYGVVSARIELRLKARPDAAPIVVPAQFAGSPKLAHGKIVPDLTAHPWAGLAVLARVVAKDAPGQTGSSGDEEFVLPEREFQHPVARALIAVRRQLSLTPEERRASRVVIDALADQPDTFDNATGILLNLRAIASLLGRGIGPEAVDEAQSRMWAVALALEEEGPDRTARALEQAREALRDAVDPTRPEPADRAEKAERDAEVDRKMQELRDAIQKRLEALAEQARREGSETPFDPSLPQMNARELDKLAQQLQQSLKDGRKQDADKQMAELEKLLEQLQNARPESGEQREQRRAQQRERGREQMDAVQDMVQREGQLLDKSESRAGAPVRPGRDQPQPEQQGQPQQRSGEAKAQQAMRRALGELMQRFGDLTGEVPAPLGEADQAMRDAAQALASGQDSGAASAARRAIEALQKGGRQMGQQMARQFGTGKQPGQGEDGQEGEGQDGDSAENGGSDKGNGRTTGPRPGDGTSPGQRRNASRDPLGRPLHQGTSGSQDAGDVRVPDEMEQARTRELQDELRRRGAERTRPRPELDYIDRLLQPF